MNDDKTNNFRNNLVETDRENLIHSVSPFGGFIDQDVRILESGNGVWLKDNQGKEVLDAFAGLWCVNAGYGQESIVQVAAEQMRRLPYATTYFGFGSEPAIELAGELTSIAPKGLDHIFFTMGGSDAVDSAIRYIIHYYNAIGKPDKKHFIALEWGYHGSSSNGAGLTALANFHRGFDLPRPWQHHIASPYPYHHPNSGDDAAIIASTISALEAKVSELGADNVAAFCCEPIQGSGGVIIPPKGWLKAIREACTRLGILMLVDEVITGFGRTGPMFACDDEDVSPDFITLAKGLTSGYSPMGAVMLADHVFQAIKDNTPNGQVVGHGFTYSAHPVSAAVGLEVLRLYRQGGLLENGVKVGKTFSKNLKDISSHPLVGDARGRGLLGALELVSNKTTKAGFDASLNIAGRLSKLTWDNNVIVRCFNNGIIGFAPALCCNDDEMNMIFERVKRALDQLLECRDIRSAIS